MKPTTLPLAAFALGAIGLTPAAAADAPPAAAPAGTQATRYCMKVEAVTGTRLERVECWTRAEWASQGVDVDRDWPEEGVRTVD
jgi:hypothetical protein